MAAENYRFVDRTGAVSEPLRLIPPVVIKKKDIDAEIERLVNLSAPANGRRESRVAHSQSGIGDGLAYTIAVSICVLKPGESTKPLRHNASLVDFCIRGGGHTNIDGQRIDYKQYDLWTTPPWSVYQHFNDTNELQVRLSYSNASLLEKLNVYILDENSEPTAEIAPAHIEAATDPKKISPFGTFPLSEDGA